MEKEWKNRPASIAEFEMLWDANKNMEIAKALILSLKNIEGLSLQEKMEFLDKMGQSNFSKPTLEVFLFLMPGWTTDFQDYGGTILSLIDYLSKKIEWLPEKDSIQGLESKIKKFVHSFLNFCQKETKETLENYIKNGYICYREDEILRILVHNQMFEELVNYNFVSTQSARTLWNFLFAKPCNALDIRAQKDEYWQLFIDTERGSEWAPTPEKARKRIKELLFSWNKVENRHALATLWTLLAKKGDLKKIFGDEKVEEIKKAE